MRPKSAISHLIVNSLLVALTCFGLAFLAFQFDKAFFIIESILIIIALIAAFLLSDMILSWFVFIVTFVATITTTTGIVYLYTWQRILLTLTIPLISLLTHRMISIWYQRQGLPKDCSVAENTYKKEFHSIRTYQKEGMSIILFEWAHSHQFYELAPRQYEKFLQQIKRAINIKWPNTTICYLGDGKYLVLADDCNKTSIDNLKQEVIDYLETTFTFPLTPDNHKHVQFKASSTTITIDNMDHRQTFDYVVQYLERQLESQIIVEY